MKWTQLVVKINDSFPPADSIGDFIVTANDVLVLFLN